MDIEDSRFKNRKNFTCKDKLQYLQEPLLDYIIFLVSEKLKADYMAKDTDFVMYAQLLLNLTLTRSFFPQYYKTSQPIKMKCFIDTIKQAIVEKDEAFSFYLVSTFLQQHWSGYQFFEGT